MQTPSASSGSTLLSALALALALTTVSMASSCSGGGTGGSGLDDGGAASGGSPGAGTGGRSGSGGGGGGRSGGSGGAGAGGTGGAARGTGGAAGMGMGGPQGTLPLDAVCVDQTNCRQDQADPVVCCLSQPPASCRLAPQCPSSVNYLACTVGSDCDRFGGGKVCCNEAVMRYCTKPSGCSGTVIP
jgi:hypothetical protein